VLDRLPRRAGRRIALTAFLCVFAWSFCEGVFAASAPAQSGIDSLAQVQQDERTSVIAADSPTVHSWQLLAAAGYVAVLAALALLGVRFLRGHKIGFGAQLSTSRIKVIEIRRATPTLTLVLVEVGSETMMIASAGSSTSIVKVCPSHG
jgi:hypothetical protein